VEYKNCHWFLAQNGTIEVTLAMTLVKQWIENEREDRLRREEEADRACNINPFNKLIIDEIYRTFTVRGGGANVLHLSRGNPGYISGLAPLRLDLRARANEPRPASATERKMVQDDAGRCSSTQPLRLRCSAGVMGVAKNLSDGMVKKRKRRKSDLDTIDNG